MKCVHCTLFHICIFIHIFFLIENNALECRRGETNEYNMNNENKKKTIRNNILNFLFFLFNCCSRWFHLAFNLIVQLLVGLPLEMVHGSTRIGCVYLAGVLAGSMGTSVFDPEVYLVGASGGVYALLAAHLANVMLNYNNMHYGIIRIVGIFLFGKLIS